ncbi:MAG TPA: YihY/virulence factor BrkB family protein [Verrucomicrobiae bacterium]|nr:YihY/virulence factor BrkB family protein [Verrucomicrobiae bacterium]
MPSTLKNIWNLLKASVSAWSNDKAPSRGAALSYYTIFAMPPLFMIAIFMASLVFDPTSVRTQMFSQVGGLIGKKSAAAIEAAMSAQYETNKGLLASAIAIVTLLVTSTGLFIELQDALNSIWGVKAKPGQGISGFIRIRLMSFAMVVGIGFLLLVSLLVSAALAAVSKFMNDLFPGVGIVSVIISGLVSFGVITLLFALIFKVLPDVKIAWRDVWIGAGVTSLLFTAGKFLLGLYLGRSTTITAYGAAGSVVLVLLWVYYSAQILFFGAEITKVYANRFGAHMKPAAYAQWVDEEQPGPPAITKSTADELPPKNDGHPGRRTQLLSELKQEIESLRHLVRR